MNRFLLDTQVFLWWLAGDNRLSAKLTDLIAHPSHQIYVSAATSWEIAIKKGLGKLQAPDNIDKIVEEEGFLRLPIRLYHGDMILKLPGIHKDPFDRMLIAQAMAEKLIIITVDRKFKNYPVEIVVA